MDYSLGLFATTRVAGLTRTIPNVVSIYLSSVSRSRRRRETEMLAYFSFGVCGLKSVEAEERAISLVARPAAISFIPNAAYKKVKGLHGARVVVRSLIYTLVYFVIKHLLMTHTCPYLVTCEEEWQRDL